MATAPSAPTPAPAAAPPANPVSSPISNPIPTTVTTTHTLPPPIVQALANKTRDDPLLRALVDRILDGSASLADNFRFLLLINQVTLEELARTRAAAAAASGQAVRQTGRRRPKTRCRN